MRRLARPAVPRSRPHGFLAGRAVAGPFVERRDSLDEERSERLTVDLHAHVRVRRSTRPPRDVHHRAAPAQRRLAVDLDVEVRCREELGSQHVSHRDGVVHRAFVRSTGTRSAFAVVFASVWLPATVVTPTSSTSGLASASSSAIASS